MYIRSMALPWPFHGTLWISLILGGGSKGMQLLRIWQHSGPAGVETGRSLNNYFNLSTPAPASVRKYQGFLDFLTFGTALFSPYHQRVAGASVKKKRTFVLHRACFCESCEAVEGVSNSVELVGIS